METVTRDGLKEMFSYVATEMAENSDKLTEMDALLGDGDLGLTMKKGFAALPELIDAADEADIGRVIAKSGMKLASIVPSTMGFLMSSGLMTGGKAISGAESIGAVEFCKFLRGYADGIVKRGKCAPGDRTVLDAIDSAAACAEKLLDENGTASLPAVAEAAEKGAEIGVEATRSMKPKYGKAAVHAAAAEGTIDQGAYAGLCLVRGIRKYVQLCK